MKADDASHVLWLCSAGKYRDHPRGGSFSPPTLVSTHHFGWDRRHTGFLLRSFHGIAGHVHQRLTLPVELAEAFLMRCLESRFRETFLEAYIPKEDAIETISVSGAQLRLTRAKAVYRNGNHQLVGLTLIREQPREPFEGDLHLFFQLRTNLGASMKTMTPERIRAGLHGEVNAV